MSFSFFFSWKTSAKRGRSPAAWEESGSGSRTGSFLGALSTSLTIAAAGGWVPPSLSAAWLGRISWAAGAVAAAAMSAGAGAGATLDSFFFGTPAAGAGSGSDTWFSAPPPTYCLSARNLTGARSLSTWIRSQISSNVLTGIPAMSTMTSPTCQPHVAPQGWTRTTLFSTSSTPRGRTWGSSGTSMITTGVFLWGCLPLVWFRTTVKFPYLSLSSSTATVSSESDPGHPKLLAQNQRPMAAAPTARGTTRRSHTHHPPGSRERKPPSSSSSLTTPADVVVVIVVATKYCGSERSAGEHARGVHCPSSLQQYSVSPEHSMSHITGASRGQRALPRCDSQHAHVSFAIEHR
mmetsp:Transcript_75867/g.214523  ORF Transcript_75867/g.214523 Transcript_75867/m.214523 type:complete len:349 (-) Transcript_75867:1083-2129(-)